jgi:hypothetical protein
MRRRPDATTRRLLEDQRSSGLTLGEYELLHGVVFEELPLPSPATQRIRRHERSLENMDGGDIKPRAKALAVPKASPAPRVTMTPEMAEARRAFYQLERLIGSPLACVTCGNPISDDPTNQLITCSNCHRQLVELAQG